MTQDEESRESDEEAAHARIKQWLENHSPSTIPGMPALVWRSHHEPQEFKCWALYSRDDYDYVALIPPNQFHNWTESSQFGCCDVTEVPVAYGWTLVVGYHS